MQKKRDDKNHCCFALNISCFVMAVDNDTVYINLLLQIDRKVYQLNKALSTTIK